MLQLLLTLATALAGEPNFPTRAFPLVGASHAIKIVDLNHDGAQDLLAVQNYVMKWLEGDGEGGFADRGVVPGSSGWWSHRIADCDGDGSLDAIGSLFPITALLHYPGDGSGGFSAGQLLDTGRYYGAELADLDNDGDLDCVAWEINSRTLRSFLRTSAGFVPGSVRQVSGMDRATLTLGDFDGDQRVDVALARDQGAPAVVFDLAILHGDGAGGFGQRSGLPSLPFWKFEAADLDGDGSSELCWANGQAVGAFRHAGARHYSLSILETEYWGDLQLLDADADGDIDLFLNGNNSHFIRLNDGSGRFPQTLWLWTHVWGPGMAVGDVDGDGQQDLAGPLPFHRVGVTLGLATRTQPEPVGRTGRSFPIAAGDIDADGEIDLLLQKRYGILGFAKGDGSGRFVPATHSRLPDHVTLERAELVDVDSDGDLDAVGWNIMDQAFAVPNDGVGGFGAPMALPFPYYAETAWSDLDGDGRSDALVAVPGQFLVYRGVQGGPGLSNPATTFSAYTTMPTVADFDGDGRAEVVGWGFPGTLRHFAWSASGSLAPTVSISCPTQPVGTCAGDVNGDGRADLVWATPAGSIQCALSSGTGSFAGAVSSPMDFDPAGLSDFALVPMDSDPFLDLVAIAGAQYWGATLFIWPGLGNGHFAAPVTLTPTAPIRLVRDFNGDGRADLALGAGAFVRPVVVLQD